MFKMKNVAFVLMLFGVCSASPELSESPEMIKKVAKLVMEQCLKSDVSSPDGFKNFLQSIDQKLYDLMESMNDTFSNFSNPSKMPFLQTTMIPSTENSSGSWMWRTIPSKENSSGSWMLDPESPDMEKRSSGMNISTFLHVLYNSMKDKEYGPELKRCVDKSRSSEMAWNTMVTNLPRLNSGLLHVLLWGAKNFFLRMKADTFRRIPSPNSTDQLELMMSFFRENYEELDKKARMEIVEWASRSRMFSQCRGEKLPPSHNQTAPVPTRKKKPPGDDCGQHWMNNRTLALLGIFIMDAPYRDFAQVRPQQFCDLFNNSKFSREISGMSDMEPRRGKYLLGLLKAHCDDQDLLKNVTGLGALACFFDDAKSLDKENTEALLAYISKCRNSDAKQNFKNIFKDLAKKQPLDKEFLRKMGPSASALSSSQIGNISDRDIPDIISDLGRGKGWSKRQSRILVQKFLKGGGQVSSGSDLVKMGSLVRGLNSRVLRNVSGEQLLQAAREGLEKEAREMSSFQRKTIVNTILQGVTSAAAIESLTGSLVKELPLYAIRNADVRSLQNLTEKPWNRGQALYLCKVLVGNGSMSASEFSQLGPLIQGVTCEMVAKYGDQFSVAMGQALGNATWLSRNQMTCAGRKLKDIINKLPANVNSPALVTLMNSIPSAILLYLGEEGITRLYGDNCGAFLAKMAEAELELLPRSSPVRGLLRERALGCLKKPVSALNGMGVAELGPLLCEFTGQNITDLSDDAFNASILQLCKCKQFHPSARGSLVTRLLRTLGSVSQWTGDTVTSLGSMITLLEEGTLLQLPDTTAVKEALLEFTASQPTQTSDALSEFQTGFDLTSVRAKIFRILQQEAAASVRRVRAVRLCPSAPTTEQIQELGEANVVWSVEQLACMSTATFEDSVDVLGGVKGFSTEQCAALKDKAVEAWGPVSDFTPENIVVLKCIVTMLTPSELQTMDFSSIDTLAGISGCAAWSQEKLSAVLGRYLTLSGTTAASLDSTQLSGLGTFACGMKSSLISQLQVDAVRSAASSLGKLTCGAETLDALKDKAVQVFGKITAWKEEDMTELGTIVAGASATDLKSLDPSLMPFLSSLAVSLIPPDRFQALSVSQLENLSPENAAAVTDAQMAQASKEQRAAVKKALGIPQTTKTTSNPPQSHSSKLDSFRLSGVTQALLTVLLLFISLPPSQ